jgi:hypothetical protein
LNDSITVINGKLRVVTLGSKKIVETVFKFVFFQILLHQVKILNSVMLPHFNLHLSHVVNYLKTEIDGIGDSRGHIENNF